MEIAMTIVTAAGVVLALLASVYLLRVKHSSERRRARQQALLIGFSKVRSEQADSPDVSPRRCNRT